MEIAIASTVISVASLAALFSTCLDALDTISAIARYGIDHEILQVKVEVEKVRLLLWGQAVGLAGDVADINKALEREYVRNAVASLLVCFVKFLEDTERLRDEYGLIEQSVNARMDAPTTPAENILGRTFKRTYDKFRNNPIKRQKETSLFTKTKWAIKDESKFRSLVKELKSINDSLGALLPGVAERARVQVRNQIMQSTDERQLQNLVNASDDVHDFISEAASLRLDVISNKFVAGGRPSILQPAQPIILSTRPALRQKSPQIEQPAPILQAKAHAMIQAEEDQSPSLPSPARPQPIPQVPIPPPQPLYDNTGALVFHKILVKEKCPTFFIWMAGMEDIKVHQQPRPLLHPSFNLFRIPPKYLKHATSLLESDPECDPEYDGWAPASVSLTGFARETFWPVRYASSREEKSWIRAKRTARPTFLDMLKRWGDIKQNGGKLESGWTEQKGYEQVRWIIGDSEYHWLDPSECYKLRHQVTDLLASLSRDSVYRPFPQCSVGMLAVQAVSDSQDNYKFEDFLEQLLHAKELSLRLERDESAVWHGGITTKIVYDMIVADLYMKNLDVTFNEEKCIIRYNVTMDTRERQSDAMLKFAEKMRWPYLTEVRDALDKSIENGQTTIRMWDWIAGLPLPGANFPVTLLFGLYQCSPITKNMPTDGAVEKRDSNFGLVLPQLSYWRSRSVLGRVLAPFDGIHDIGGWVGPCPTPAIVTTSGVSTFLGLKTWMPTLKTRTPSFAMQENARDLNTANTAPASTFDGTWEEPLAPASTQEICQLKSFQLATLPPEDPYEKNTSNTYQAKIDFWLVQAQRVVTMTLYTNSVFIAAPPCRGTHCIGSGVRGMYARKMLELSNIDGAGLSPDVITVINGASGGGEALARAWCSQIGTNAILWKRHSDCCFKCALMLASKEGLDVNVLIITM